MLRRSLRVVTLLIFAGSPITAQQRWTVDAKPTLDIKGVNDAGAVAFGTANWATRLANGTVVIADGATPAVQFFDATGKPLKSAGRAGQGPGDFRTVTWVGQCAKDSVFAWDFAQTRVTTYDAAGTLGRIYPFGTRGSAQTFTSCNLSGTLVQFGAARRIPPPAPPDPKAAYAVVGIVATPQLIGPKGDTLATFAEVPYGEVVAGDISGRGGRGGMTRPLGPNTPVAVGADRVYLGRADSASIAVHAFDGRRIGTIPVRVPERATTTAHYEHAADIMLAMMPAQARAAARKWVLGIPAPAKLPPFTGLFVDPSGLVWAVLTSPGDPDTRLRAFRADGSPVADASVPINLNVFEIGTDYILGAFSDADDETHVVVFRLRRGR